MDIFSFPPFAIKNAVINILVQMLFHIVNYGIIPVS